MIVNALSVSAFKFVNQRVNGRLHIFKYYFLRPEKNYTLFFTLRAFQF